MNDENIDKLIEDSIVVDNTGLEDGLSKDMSMIMGEMTNDANVFRFSRYNDYINFYDALLQSIRDKPNYDKIFGKEVKTRYCFLDRFLYHYHIGRGALKSGMLESFKDTASSLLAFRGG